jgi:hypothetical protein
VKLVVLFDLSGNWASCLNYTTKRTWFWEVHCWWSNLLWVQYVNYSKFSFLLNWIELNWIELNDQRCSFDILCFSFLRPEFAQPPRGPSSNSPVLYRMFIDIADYAALHQSLLQPKGFAWTYLLLGIIIGGFVLKKSARLVWKQKELTSFWCLCDCVEQSGCLSDWRTSLVEMSQTKPNLK